MTESRTKQRLRTDTSFCFLCKENGSELYRDARDYFFGTEGKWCMAHCANCALYWLDPQPRPEVLANAYKAYYTHQLPSDKKPKKIKKIKRQFRLALLNALCGYSIPEVNPKFSKLLSLMPVLKEYALKSFGWIEGPHNTGRLLDYGCGNGSFLNQMRKLGWEVSGIEFDERSAETAYKYFGIPVILEDSKETILQPNFHDAVTMNHVIEHLQNPLKTLQFCHETLCVGGQIVITTPNANSLAHRLYKQAWRGLEFPRHLFVFTPKSLCLLVEKAGFDILSVKTLSRSARWIWAISRQAKRKPESVSNNYNTKNPLLKLASRCFQSIEGGLSYFMPLGEELLIIAKKNSR